MIRWRKKTRRRRGWEGCTTRSIRIHSCPSSLQNFRSNFCRKWRPRPSADPPEWSRGDRATASRGRSTSGRAWRPRWSPPSSRIDAGGSGTAASSRGSREGPVCLEECIRPTKKFDFLTWLNQSAILPYLILNFKFIAIHSQLSFVD